MVIEPYWPALTYGTTPAEVIHWLEQTLHDRTHGNGTRRLLHRFVRVVAWGNMIPRESAKWLGNAYLYLAVMLPDQ